MSSSLTGVLVGRDRTGHRQAGWAVLAIVAFGISFAGYALGFFSIPGGIVWIPGHAALVGMCAAVLVGYGRGGAVVAWLVTYAALLGYSAQRALFGYSNSTPSEELAYFFDPEGLLVLGLEGLVLGLIAFAVGSLLRYGDHIYRRHADTNPDP